MDKSTSFSSATIVTIFSAIFTVFGAAIIAVLIYYMERVDGAISKINTEITEIKIDVAVLKSDVATLKIDFSKLESDNLATVQ